MLPVDGGELANARVLAIGMCQGIPQAAVACGSATRRTRPGRRSATPRCSGGWSPWPSAPRNGP